MTDENKTKDELLNELRELRLQIAELKNSEAERKHTEEELAESLIENSAVATFVLTPQHKIVSWNKACEELTGFSASEMLGTDNQWKPFYARKRQVLADLIIDVANSEEDISVLYGAFTQPTLLKTGLHSEGWYHNLNGRDRYIIFDAAPIYTARGELSFVIETLQDITERKRLEDEEKKQLHFLQELIDAMPNPIFFKDTKGIYLGCNKSLESFLGMKKEQIVGKSVYDVAANHLADKYYEADRALLSQPGVQTYESSVVATDGTKHEVIFYKATFLNPDGTLGGLVGTIVDISERKRLEEALKESEMMLRAIIDTAPQCIKLVAADGTLLAMNPAGLAMVEADSIDQVKGKEVCSLVAPQYRDSFRKLMEKVLKGESGELEFDMIGLKGTHRYMSTHEVPFRNAKGEIVALLGITYDITENRKLRDQLLQAQKMDAVGQLAGGIAHDFNNILTAIMGYGGILHMKIRRDDPLIVNVEQILEAADKAASLTQNLLAFSRKQIMNAKPVNINDIILRTEKFILRIIGEDIEIRTKLSDEILTVNIDSAQMEHALINLATNARDAMPHGGVLSIETELYVINDEFIKAHGFGSLGKFALISVTDTGVGMDKETSDKIFEPFFTTKEMGKGTGLGLAMVYGTVKQHNGHITVYSEQGKGTIFKIYIPLVSLNIEKEGEVSYTSLPVGGTETILVAEDDSVLRKLHSKVLTEYGYNVILAEDGEDAINKFRDNKDKIHICILDMIMPKKGGKEVNDAIKNIRSDVKILFASGYAADRTNKEELLEKGLNFIQKPISPNEFLKKIRAVLDQ